MENGGITLSDFNLDRALGGASIGWQDAEGNIVQAFDFKRQNADTFSYIVDNNTYYCDKTGLSTDSSHTLHILNLEITETKGTSASRGDSAGGTEIISIESLEPRETFACHALTGLLFAIPESIQMDNVMMNSVVKKSFEIAQLMMQEAARVRAETPEESTGDTSIDINPALITSTTDKILYNINTNLNKIATQDKDFHSSVQTDGIKINGTPSVDIASVSAGSLPVSGSVDVTNTVSVSVTNLPESGG